MGDNPSSLECAIVTCIRITADDGSGSEMGVLFIHITKIIHFGSVINIVSVLSMSHCWIVPPRHK